MTNKAPSIASLFKKLQHNVSYTKIEYWVIKYLTNLIGQNHRPIKQRIKFHQFLLNASIVIKRMKATLGIYKKTEEMTLFGFSVSIEIKISIGISA